MSDINKGLVAENQNLSEFEITENFSCVRFLDQNNERIIPEPLMPIANSTKIPWTVIFVAFLVSYFIGMYIKNIV